MPLWKRARSGSAELDLARRSFEPKSVIGDLQCMSRDCPRLDAALCAYEDRRGTGCETAVCPIHQVMFGDHAYCRPHAATLSAIGDVPQSARPDVDNLAPALVTWVFRDLHDRMVAMLDPLVNRSRGETLVIDPTARSLRGADGSWRWNQGWRINSPTGAVLTVLIDVMEVAAMRISVRVGATPIDDYIPPWMVLRGDDSVDERADFYNHILDLIGDAVDKERALDKRYERFGH